MPNQQKLKILYLSAGTAAIVWTLILGTTVHSALFNQQVAAEVAAAPKPDPFAGVKLEAKAAVVYDVESGQVVYSREGETQLPLASLTKVMTALVASQLLPSATLIPINADALATLGDSGFREGEEWQLSELVDFTLVTSSNDGARAIAQAAEQLTRRNFISEMNARAAALGLSQTYFQNETGLDLGPARPGASGSAYDVAKLFSHILKERPEILAATSRSTVQATSLEHAYFGRNTNNLAAVMPGILGSKTGYTDLAGGNLAVVVDAGLRQPYVIVIMGSSQEGRFRDVERLTGALNTWTQLQ
jgi:serine-type D-Ala-D-Ala carboxypeptidase (penicillin-binding protein 5/6)